MYETGVRALKRIAARIVGLMLPSAQWTRRSTALLSKALIRRRLQNVSDGNQRGVAQLGAGARPLPPSKRGARRL
jgi:hypothetical protein